MPRGSRQRSLLVGPARAPATSAATEQGGQRRGLRLTDVGDDVPPCKRRSSRDQKHRRSERRARVWGEMPARHWRYKRALPVHGRLLSLVRLATYAGVLARLSVKEDACMTCSPVASPSKSADSREASHTSNGAHLPQLRYLEAGCDTRKGTWGAGQVTAGQTASRPAAGPHWRARPRGVRLVAVPPTL